MIGCVASQTPEDFTAHLEMHPLTNLLWSIQRFLPTSAIPEGSVVEATIDRTSWGKSKDAPLETHTLLNLAEYQAPTWCHVHKSTSSSSRRTQVAAVAYRYKQYELLRHSTIHRQCLNKDKKRHKQIINLKDVTVGKVPLSEKVQCLKMSHIRNNIVVCDGGDIDCDGIKNHLLITIFTTFEYVMVIYG